jgi:hypothetical protein
MKFTEILEWTMGWAWPIMIGIVILIAWGVERIMTWDKQDLSEEQSSGPITGKHCVCQCE